MGYDTGAAPVTDDAKSAGPRMEASESIIKVDSVGWDVHTRVCRASSLSRPAVLWTGTGVPVGLLCRVVEFLVLSLTNWFVWLPGRRAGCTCRGAALAAARLR